MKDKKVMIIYQDKDKNTPLEVWIDDKLVWELERGFFELWRKNGN